MRTCKQLMLVFLTHLFAASCLSIEEITFTSETTNLQEHHISLALNSNVSYKAIAITKKQVRTNSKTSQLSRTRNPGGISWKDSETLLSLLLGIIKAELSQCILTIIWDSSLVGSIITETLSFLPNIKQVWLWDRKKILLFSRLMSSLAFYFN